MLGRNKVKFKNIVLLFEGTGNQMAVNKIFSRI
jgi:hypothetical protein